jgi:hypothetical protein
VVNDEDDYDEEGSGDVEEEGQKVTMIRPKRLG